MPDEKTGEFLGTGRRKSATARVRIKPGNGKITVNKRPFEAYFPVEEHRWIVGEPFEATAWELPVHCWSMTPSCAPL